MDLVTALQFVGVPVQPAGRGGGSVDVELSFDGEGRLSGEPANLHVIVQAGTWPTSKAVEDAWHECHSPARLLQMEAGRGYLAPVPATIGAGNRVEQGYLLAIETPGFGLSTQGLVELAQALPDARVLLATPRPEGRRLPPNIETRRPDSPEALHGLLCGASILLAGEREGYDPAPGGVLVAAQILGIPVLAWTDCPGGMVATLVEEGVSGFVCGVGDASHYVAAARGLPRARMAASAALRLGSATSVGLRLRTWARLLAAR